MWGSPVQNSFLRSKQKKKKKKEGFSSEKKTNGLATGYSSSRKALSHSFEV
jgi:hypothetical protein